MAVAILYYLQLTEVDVTPDTSETAIVSDTTMPEEVTIAYIHEDSLLANYTYFKDLASGLEKKRQQMEEDYTSRAQGLQTEIQNFQQTAGNMTLNQARAVEEDLMRKQQNLVKYQERLAQDMMNEESRVNQQLYKRVTDFMKEYADRKGFTVVLNYRPGSVMLYGHPGMNVTQEVLQGLNEEYAASMSGAQTGQATPASSDTTSAGQ